MQAGRAAAAARGSDVAGTWGSRWSDWLAPIALFLLGLALYSINLDKPPRFDELYHVLAARGYLEYGEPRIAEGLYERARYFTYVISLLFGSFGESLAVARIPGVFCTSLLVVLIFVWVRGFAGSLAAWLAAGMFLVSPFAAQVGQDVRFYAPFMLLFWLAAMAVYAATTSEPSSAVRRTLYALAAVVCLGTALHLQPLAMLAGACLGLWVALQVGLPWLRASGVLDSYLRIAGALTVAAVVIVILAQVLPFAGLVHRYRHTPLFDAATRDHFWFYHQWLDLYYPTLWPLFPLAALAAIANWPRPALFCLCVFVPSLLLLSFGGVKSLLYMSFALPFLFVLWGMAIAYVWTEVRGFIVDVTDRALSRLGFPGRAIRMAVIAAMLGFILLANTATIRTATMLAGIAVPPEVPPARWSAAADILGPWLEQAAVVVTSSELDALYYFGDYDILLSKTRLTEFSPSDEFGRDVRTGRPVIGAASQSIERVMDCFADGLIVVDAYSWRRAAYVDDATANLIVERAEPVPLPPELRLLAFHWTSPERMTTAAPCQDLRQLVQPDPPA